VELDDVAEPHAAFLTESRTRGHGQGHVQEIRVNISNAALCQVGILIRVHCRTSNQFTDMTTGVALAGVLL
jgi:hypothetical protein